MALAAFDSGQPKIQPGPGIPQILHGNKEAAAQTFKAGHLVYLNAGAVTYYPGGDTPVAGIALADGTNVSSSNAVIPIQVIGPNDEVIMQVATSADVLQTCNTTCAVGVAYDTNASVAVASYIDSSDTGNPCFVFLGPVYDATGAANTWGRFRLMGPETQVKAP